MKCLRLLGTMGLVWIGAETPVAADAPLTPVLVELFTSEGCSSCPPADAVLAGLERTQGVPGARVVPLGLHVDYWDALGWVDPFSSAQASERQRGYAPLGKGSYTPQAVIDGRAEVVGSRRGALESAVAEAAKRPHATIVVEPSREGASLAITLRIGALPAGAASDAEVIVALSQGVARVDVKRGENAGAMLEHTAVARELIVVGVVPPGGGTQKVTRPLPADSRGLRVVAFVQERASRHVLGSTTVPLPARE
jgi:hypothetical protein